MLDLTINSARSKILVQTLYSMQLTIGKVAKQTGVTIETIRYYQRIGLVQEPVKPKTGYRHYSTEIISKIQFIKRAQKVGFALKEIAELLSLDGSHCNEVRHLAEQKCQKIDQQIENLKNLRQTLSTLIKICEQSSTKEHCAILDALNSDSQST